MKLTKDMFPEWENTLHEYVMESDDELFIDNETTLSMTDCGYDDV